MGLLREQSRPLKHRERESTQLIFYDSSRQKKKLIQRLMSKLDFVESFPTQHNVFDHIGTSLLAYDLLQLPLKVIASRQTIKRR